MQIGKGRKSGEPRCAVPESILLQPRRRPATLASLYSVPIKPHVALPLANQPRRLLLLLLLLLNSHLLDVNRRLASTRFNIGNVLFSSNFS
ncbi:hypothetical protein V2J09_010861 [Rumex salicifolius]